MALVFFNHAIRDEHIPFNAQDYSMFKFGSKKIAKFYGKQLARNVFLNEHFSTIPKNQQIVVCSSPYCFIPTATFAMKDYFIQRLNEFLIHDDRPVVEETKIHRTITYKEDYGSLSAEERMKLIGKDSFHIDKDFVRNKLVIFLDDIRITGSHERVIQKMIDDYGLKCDYVFAYYAVLANSDIHPSIENDLNYAYVKNLLDLDHIIKNEDFLINTRVVKYLLNYDHEEFKTFIQYQSYQFVSNLWHLAIGNSYHLIDDYKKNLEFTFKIKKI